MTKYIGTISKKRCGFTLIEALIATALLGFAIGALLMANQSFSSANGAGLEMSTAEFLIEQIREATVTKAFSQLPGLNGVTYSPPHDSQGNTLTAYPGYKQEISVQNISTFGPNADFCNITVKVYLNKELLSSASWVRANY